MTPDAPFCADLADGPEGGHALWLTAEDGVQFEAPIAEFVLSMPRVLH
jgi:uncharacterized protein affecting Mg2+/Co2+ transport